MCSTDHGIPQYSNRGLPRIVTKKIIFNVDCHNQESKFESRLPRVYSCCCKPQYTWERFAKGLICAIRARPATTDWYPVPAILHMTAPYLRHYLFLTQDLTGVNPIRGELFRPKSGVSVCYTFLWHYTFNKPVQWRKTSSQIIHEHSFWTVDL
jgi:hypothetical protein